MNLPNPLDVLVKAFNTKDSSLFISCFTQDAEVQDKGEDQSARGQDAIRNWFDGGFAKFDFSTEPFDHKETIEGSLLKAKVRGNFPGSPLNFLYEVQKDGDLIKKLKISILDSK
jgi:hypothetical protein